MIGGVAREGVGDESTGVEPICYLCGKILAAGGPVDSDHVPPRLIFPPSRRRARGTNLLTLDVHRKCHEGYGRDEEYFVQAVGPVAHGSPTGTALFDET